MRKIYMDHAATTPVRPEVMKEMRPFFDSKYGNPASIHYFGREASEAVELARSRVAKALGALPNEIIFTSGGTEADNLALIGGALANRGRGKHIITSKMEHHAVLHTCDWLSKNGFDVTYLPVDKQGLVSPEAVEGAIRDDTILVSIMHANNEIGTVEPIEEIGKICKEKGILFHTDAVQSFCKIPLSAKNADMITLSGHKIYGPKGVGALYVRGGVKVEPILHGGGHERGLRSGTENVPGIVGFGKAAELGIKEILKESKRLESLRNMLIKGALGIEKSQLTGHPKHRLPHNASFIFSFIEGEALLLSLDDAGIAGSTGSACSSKSLEPSHVLLACGLRPEQAHGSLRLTLGRQNTKEDVKYVLDVLPKSVERLRKISPFKKGYLVREK